MGDSAKFVEEFPQPDQRPGAMADRIFDVFAQLGERLGKPLGDEQRIVPKTMGAGGGPGDPPLAGTVDPSGFCHEILLGGACDQRSQREHTSKARGAAFVRHRVEEAQ